MKGGMDYSEKLKYHYKPYKDWVNDPNGLVWFGGYFHVFYQHSPDFKIPHLCAPKRGLSLSDREERA